MNLRHSSHSACMCVCKAVYYVVIAATWSPVFRVSEGRREGDKSGGGYREGEREGRKKRERKIGKREEDREGEKEGEREWACIPCQIGRAHV